MGGENQKPMDYCGVFGIYCQDKCLSRTETGTFSQQHRGTTKNGLSGIVGDNIITETGKGLVKEFYKNRQDLRLTMKDMNLAIGCASVTSVPIEPCYGNFDFSIALNGRIFNQDEIAEDYRQNGRSFHTKEDIEILAKEIASGNNPVDGIKGYLNKMLEGKILGSTSAVMLTKEGVYVFRDPWGVKPLSYGSFKDRKQTVYFAASEDRAMQVLSGKIIDMTDVKPGEILLINKNGIKSMGRIDSGKRKHCAFEWGYTASFDSKIELIPVHLAREYIGKKLAQKDRNRDGRDVVVAGIPQSGVGHALGYHSISGHQYGEVFHKFGFSGRSYILPTQEERDREAQQKLTLIPSSIKDKIIFLEDDSIVRGTQMRKKVESLMEAGAREVHVRVGCPPLVQPCFGDKSTKSQDELAARKYPESTLEDKMCKEVGANSLKYNSVDDLLDAIIQADLKWNGKQTITEDDFCTYCFDREAKIPTISK